MPSCKEFLQELNDFLDETVDPETKRMLQAHVEECPNCYVIVDTVKKTLAVYKGAEPQPVPEEIHARVWRAFENKMAAARAKKAV